MILGIGVDLVDVRRVESIIFRWKEKFLKRIFTESEIRYCNTKKNPAERFATRYAAKHAVVKALYPKEMAGVSLRNIEIEQGEGRPRVQMRGGIGSRAAEMGVKSVHLMVSHDGDYAVANVVLEG